MQRCEESVLNKSLNLSHLMPCSNEESLKYFCFLVLKNECNCLMFFRITGFILLGRQLYFEWTLCIESEVKSQ